MRPVINELGNPAKGRVEYVNDGLTPLNVVLEAKSFTVSENGEISYRPLDPNIHLKLSATSFRIQPQQTYYVFYEASAPPSPTWFVIYASFSGFAFRTAQGMNVRLQLPHTVYLLPKQRVEKADVRVVRAEINADDNKVLLEVENTGDNFGRVLQTQLAKRRKKQEAPGFPIFPHSRRILEVPLDAKAGGCCSDRCEFPIRELQGRREAAGQSEQRSPASFRIDLSERKHWGKALEPADAPAIPMRAPGGGDAAGRKSECSGVSRTGRNLDDAQCRRADRLSSKPLNMMEA